MPPTLQPIGLGPAISSTLRCNVNWGWPSMGAPSSLGAVNTMRRPESAEEGHVWVHQEGDVMAMGGGQIRSRKGAGSTAPSPTLLLRSDPMAKVHMNLCQEFC